MRILATAFVLLLCSVSAQAANWKIDYDKSKIGYTIIWDKEPSNAIFQKWQGQIDFDPAQLGSSKITATIETGSGASDFPDYDSDRAGPSGFDAKAFPTATFATKAIRSLGGNKYEATGTLTLKGVAKDIVLPFTLDISGNNAHAVGAVKINRSDFKIGNGKTMGINFDSDDPVARMVTVDIDVVATKAP